MRSCTKIKSGKPDRTLFDAEMKQNDQNAMTRMQYFSRFFNIATLDSEIE